MNATVTQDVDAAAVIKWMRSLAIDVDPPLRISPVGEGKSNITVRLTDAADRHWVLRRPPHGDLLASAHDVAREHRILAALQASAVPTPGVIAFTSDTAVSPAPLLIMEYVDGLVVDRISIAQSLSPNLRCAIGIGMVDALALVHDVDLDSTGLATLASHVPYASRQLRRWIRQWEASRTRDRSEVDELAARLLGAIPEQRELSLVHGDFHLRNVIVDPVSGRTRAIVDWELSTLGDPVADLGTLLAYWPEAGDPPGAPFDASTLPGFPTRAELSDAYATRTGRDLTGLGFWEVLALWKIAIILEGVRRRALNDPRNAARGALFDEETIDFFLARARRRADEIRL